jgi:hypothetical protein
MSEWAEARGLDAPTPLSALRRACGFFCEPEPSEHFGLPVFQGFAPAGTPPAAANRGGIGRGAGYLAIL